MRDMASGAGYESHKCWTKILKITRYLEEKVLKFEFMGKQKHRKNHNEKWEKTNTKTSNQEKSVEQQVKAK